jgi:hypothetical protein
MDQLLLSIRDRIKTYGIRQSELVKEAHVSKATLNRVIKKDDRGKVRGSTLKKIDLAIDSILANRQSQTTLNTFEDESISVLREDQAKILQEILAIDDNNEQSIEAKSLALRLYRTLLPTFKKISALTFDDDEKFYQDLCGHVARLTEGDRILAVCGRKFWNQKKSTPNVNTYWDLNKEKSAANTLIQRVFVADQIEPINKLKGKLNSAEGYLSGFSNEARQTFKRHQQIKNDLKRVQLPNGQFVDRSSRFRLSYVGMNHRELLRNECLLDPQTGFALISKGGEKYVSYHISKGKQMRGCIIEDPIIYALFEIQFWKIWNYSKEVETT